MGWDEQTQLVGGRICPAKLGFNLSQLLPSSVELLQALLLTSAHYYSEKLIPVQVAT